MRDDPGLCWKSLTEQLMAASNISIDKLCLKDEGREVELFRSIPAQMKESYPSKVRQIPKKFPFQSIARDNNQPASMP